MNKPHLHTCSVPSCTTIIRDSDLMCREHWRLVPLELRSEVTKATRGHHEKELSESDLAAVQARATDAAQQACGAFATSLSVGPADRSGRRKKGGA